MSLPSGCLMNALSDPTRTATWPSWWTSTEPIASSSEVTACHSMLWLTGCWKIWRSVLRWRLSRCSDSGEDVIVLLSGKTLRYVLVIGVDGVRFDLLGPEVTPVIWGFGSAGFLGPVPVDETTPTWSGPCWATIATGMGVDGHGITGNDLTGHRLAEHPDFVTVATRAGVSTLLAVSGWPPLALAEDGGPLFAEASRREFVAVPEASLAWDSRDETSLAIWDAADEAITQLAAAILAQDGPRVSFIYLGGVDTAGHVAGVGGAYRAAVRAADERVGRLLAAVRSRLS